VNYKSALEKNAIALFTEKYGDIVRVVNIDSHSIELCGGTHASSTGQLGKNNLFH